MDWLVERNIRPRYEQTVALFARLVDAGHLPDIPAPHLYYILTGAGRRCWCRAGVPRLAGIDTRGPTWSKPTPTP